MSLEEVVREIDEWIARPLPFRADETLAALKAEEEKRRRAVREAEEELAQVQHQLAKLEDALNLKRYIESRGGQLGRSDAGATTFYPQGNGEVPNRGRAAVLRLLSEFSSDREWTIAEVVSALAARGWADSDDHHAVSVSLSRLARSGNLRRRRKGVYSLAEREAENSPVEDEGETGPGPTESMAITA